MDWRIVAVLSTWLAAGCADATSAAETSSRDGTGWTANGPWRVTVAAELGEKLGGCAIGDVDADRPGNELVTVSESGAVSLVWHEDGEWGHRAIGRASGEMIQCAVGELERAHRGEEIVVVGMAVGGEDDGGEGAAHVLFRDGDGWEMREIHRSPALIHATCLADFDGDGALEVLVAGYARKAVVLEHGEDGWSATEAASIAGAAKGAVAHGGGAAIACADGRVVHLVRGEGGWTTAVLDEAPGGQARIASDEERLLVARDDGALGLLEGGRRRDIHREGAKLRGAVLANLDPRSPGLEAATAGYEGRLTVLRSKDGAWVPETVDKSGDRLHHATSGVLSSVGPGVALVTCGYDGELVVALFDAER